jgi:hypothetical protein
MIFTDVDPRYAGRLDDKQGGTIVTMAKIGLKSSKTAARLAAEFGVTAKAVRDVWRGKTWADQTRCVWTVQSAKDYIPPALSSAAAAARVKRALGRV